MLEQIPKPNYEELTDAFRRIRRHGKDSELLSLLTTMHEADELEFCEERSHDTIRYWKAKKNANFEDRWRMVESMRDGAQRVTSLSILMGHAAFTTDREIPPNRIFMTGLGEYSYRPKPGCTPEHGKHPGTSAEAGEFRKTE